VYDHRIRRFFCILLTCGACAGSATPPQPLPQPHTRLAAAVPAPAPRPRATIVYEAAGQPSPLPLVKGTLGGKPILLLVDTGADSHFIAGHVARKYGIKTKKLREVSTDHVGRTVQTALIEKPALALDEWGDLGLEAVLTIEMPHFIEALGIGGVVSPQRLVAEAGAIVLDLAKGELRSASWEKAKNDLTGTVLVDDGQAKACEENDGPVKNLSFVVPAMIETQRVKLLIDTGAHYSDVFAGSAAGQKLAPQSVVTKDGTYTASGRFSARKVKGARVSAGGFAVTTDVNLVPGAAEPSCPCDGVLAMDFLRACTLVFGGTHVVARCK
jgi:predicted aspartyl protease